MEAVAGDSFMAVKPWLGVVKNSVPTNYKRQKGDNEAPDASLELEYIHGYRCEDARNNLRYTRTGDIVYHTAAVGVVLDPVENKQKHILEHIDDIICLAIHPGLQVVATGEIGPNPLICVWDSGTMECLARISGTLTKGICHLAFSNNGKFLAATAADNDHCIAVYEWEKCLTAAKVAAGKGKAGGLVASGKGSQHNLLGMVFNPTDDVVVAPGIREVNFYTFAGGLIKGKKGTGWGSNKQQTILCAAFVETTLVTGSFGGQLFLWKGNTLSGTLAAHKGCVNSIYARGKGKGAITGGNDGLIILWDASMKKQTQINLVGDKTINIIVPKVRSVCESAEGNILVGTRSGEIVEYRQNKPKVVMRSHFKDELWGLAVNPKKPEYATLGQDGMFAIWDVNGKKQKQFAKMDCTGDVIAYSPDGVYLVLGLTSGQVIVLNATNFSTVATRKDRTLAISVKQNNKQF